MNNSEAEKGITMAIVRSFLISGEVNNIFENDLVHGQNITVHAMSSLWCVWRFTLLNFWKSNLFY